MQRSIFSERKSSTILLLYMMAQLAIDPYEGRNHTAVATIQPNGINADRNPSSNQQDPDQDLRAANDNIENDTIGSDTADDSSADEDDDDFPPLIPGPNGIHVFIERDYRFAPRLVFPEVMPSDLLHIEGLQVDQTRFETLIRKLNVVYEKTEHVNCMSVVETFIQMASCYASLLCFTTQHRRYIEHADRVIAHANDEWKRAGVPLFMVSPRERGMRCIELIAMPAAAAVRPITIQGTTAALSNGNSTAIAAASISAENAAVISPPVLNDSYHLAVTNRTNEERSNSRSEGLHDGSATNGPQVTVNGNNNNNHSTLQQQPPHHVAEDFELQSNGGAASGSRNRSGLL